jgi:hypothetical protein
MESGATVLRSTLPAANVPSAESAVAALSTAGSVDPVASRIEGAETSGSLASRGTTDPAGPERLVGNSIQNPTPSAARTTAPQSSRMRARSGRLPHRIPGR